MSDWLAAGGGAFTLVAAFAIALVLLVVGAVLLLRRPRRGAVRSGSRLHQHARRSAGRIAFGALCLVLAVALAAVATLRVVREQGRTPEILPDTSVTFESGGVTFHASYRAPSQGGAPVAAAVIVGGTGAVDRDGDGAGIAMEEYAWLAGRLADAGVASVRYDKLGTAATGLGPFEEDPNRLLAMSYDEVRIQPVRDALAYLAAQPGIDPTRLLLLGHSEGGAVTLTAAHEPRGGPNVAGLLLIEPSYDRILDVVPSQLSQQMDAAVSGGVMTESDAAELEAWMLDGVAAIRASPPPYPSPGPVPLPGATGYAATMQSTIERNIYGSDPLQMVVSHAYRTGYGREFDAIDPVETARRIDVPVLITCGTKDFNTPCGDGSAGSGIAYLSTQFGPGIATFVELPNVVHILRDVGAAEDVMSLADQIAFPFSERLANELAAFLATYRN